MLHLVWSGEEQQTLQGLCGKSLHGFAPLARTDPADRKVLKVLSCLQLVSRKEMTTLPRAVIVKNPLNRPETVSVHPHLNTRFRLKTSILNSSMFGDGCRGLRSISSDILDAWLCCRLFTAACPWVIKSSLSSGINYNMLRQHENTRSSTSQHQPRRRLVGVKINARTQH